MRVEREKLILDGECDQRERSVKFGISVAEMPHIDSEQTRYASDALLDILILSDDLYIIKGIHIGYGISISTKPAKAQIRARHIFCLPVFFEKGIEGFMFFIKAQGGRLAIIYVN
jgi:hypothetical protein